MMGHSRRLGMKPREAGRRLKGLQYTPCTPAQGRVHHAPKIAHHLLKVPFLTHTPKFPNTHVEFYSSTGFRGVKE